MLFALRSHPNRKRPGRCPDVCSYSYEYQKKSSEKICVISIIRLILCWIKSALIQLYLFHFWRKQMHDEPCQQVGNRTNAKEDVVANTNIAQQFIMVKHSAYDYREQGAANRAGHTANTNY